MSSHHWTVLLQANIHCLKSPRILRESKAFLWVKRQQRGWEHRQQGLLLADIFPVVLCIPGSCGMGMDGMWHLAKYIGWHQIWRQKQNHGKSPIPWIPQGIHLWPDLILSLAKPAKHHDEISLRGSYGCGQWPAWWPREAPSKLGAKDETSEPRGEWIRRKELDALVTVTYKEINWHNLWNRLEIIGIGKNMTKHWGWADGSTHCKVWWESWMFTVLSGQS